MLEIKKSYILTLADHRKRLNHLGGRSQMVKESKKQIGLKFYEDTIKKLDDFSTNNNLTRTQTIEALIELLPYIEKLDREK